jgi:hypothetical protein
VTVGPTQKSGSVTTTMASIASSNSFHDRGTDPGQPRRSQRIRNKHAALAALGLTENRTYQFQFEMIHAVFLAIMFVTVGLVVYCFSLIPADWGGRNLFLGIIGLLAGVALVVDNLVLVSGFCKP